MHLTPEEWAVLNQQGEVSMCIDGIRCVVVRADVYDRLKRQATSDAAPRPREYDLDAPAGWNNDGGDIDVDDYLS